MKPELLAPAGGFEQLKTAIAFGADAVYLASERFGMRQRANNFTLEQLPRVIAYAHERGVKVHVACNIVMHDDDIGSLGAYLEALEAAGADAVIVGDLGAARLARKYAPHVALHVSTQASVSNAQAALVWHELGATRIVCAREMSVAQIAVLREQLPDALELEAFVHGSMCMAYSGRCLISDYLTGRSALSGHCTQPCRWHYVLEEEKRPGEYYPIEQDAQGSYILNAQDLNMLAHLHELEEAGICSFKIEGRNKKAFYVATVVNAYRQVIDGAPVETFAHELETVSHRPYSTGFFFGPAHQATLSDEREQLYEWVAEVLSCEASADGTYAARVQCRNAFSCDAPLEVLSPGRLPFALEIASLRYIAVDELGEHEPLPVQRADRAMELYSFETAHALAAGDFIRTPKVG